MKKISVLIAAVAVVALTATAGTWGAEPSSLVGTWRLVAFEDHPDQGPVEYPFGEHPKGLLIYDATGHMAIQIMKTPHPKVSSGDAEKVTPEEKAALFDAYVAYFGKYRVDAERGVVVHQVEGDLSDAYMGKDQERPYELTGNRLVLKPRWEGEGRTWLGIRVFERVPPNR